MNVLIIGGTRFVGPHTTDALVGGGHRVTLFNRGTSEASTGSAVLRQAQDDGIEIIYGDRKTDLERTGDRRWDAVIDTCGFTPDVVELSARHFMDRTDRYLFVSTISVYDESQTTGPDEDAQLHKLPPEADPAEFNVEQYGALKALCEDVVLNTYRHRATILRPGLIAGPYDFTDRFTYWPLRFEAGGDVLVPVSPNEPLQYIDVRDLAAFAVHAIQGGVGGTYNCVTPRGVLHFGDLVESCEAVAHAGARPVWADARFLSAHEVSPWSDLPGWIPDGDSHRAVTNADSSRALVQGLRTRALTETVRDTLAWAHQAGKQLGSLAAGLTPSREQQLLTEVRAPKD